ncbi:MAG: nucleotidyltransferase family protein [Bacteroidetes bacterium]|nr:nucleotidyltransferase family protein [Bacteroidota bacterium]
MNHLTHIKNELEKMKPELLERFFVSEIGLFGSITRDDFTANSDVDIIVDFNKPIGIEFIDLADFIESKLHRRVDLISKKALREYFYLSIEKEIQYV